MNYLYLFFPCVQSTGSTKEKKGKSGLVRELNPGPLTPKARIMPLDQQATAEKGGSVSPYKEKHNVLHDIHPHLVLNDVGLLYLSPATLLNSMIDTSINKSTCKMMLAKVGIVPSFKFTTLNLISNTASIFVNSY